MRALSARRVCNKPSIFIAANSCRSFFWRTVRNLKSGHYRDVKIGLPAVLAGDTKALQARATALLTDLRGRSPVALPRRRAVLRKG